MFCAYVILCLDNGDIRAWRNECEKYGDTKDYARYVLGS
jgi:hypothetical protein